MSDEHPDAEPVEPATLDEALETIRALRKELGSVRKESARRRLALKERDGQEADASIWRTVAIEAVAHAEATAAGARRPELLGRLVDLGEIEAESLDEIRSTVRQRIDEALEQAPELRADAGPVGALSPGPRLRERTPRADPDAWLRRAARSG